MEVFDNINVLKEHIYTLKKSNLTIGFVPTMGALHQGHFSLVKKAKKENAVCVCSIFVNPLQFNKKEDLVNYPRTLDRDLEQLRALECDIIFTPTEKEILPETGKIIYDLGDLDKGMEGTFRPGHFNGVAVIVRKLFDIIEPDKAYFGEKDYQQLIIIEYMVKKVNIPVKINRCETVREVDGLAMSSRNLRLSVDERKVAPVIYQVLKKIKEMAISLKVDEIKLWVKQEILKYPVMKLEYFEIVNRNTLKPLDNIDVSGNGIACIAVFVGNIRLIDNIKI